MTDGALRPGILEAAPRRMPAEASPRQRIADGVGLGIILLALLDVLHPSLLLLPTIAAGGDTPCHYPAAAWFSERLLPSLRLHGWYPGAYLGHPLFLYYFPLPFVLIAALAPVAGLPVAFKLGTALGVFLLPLLTWASFRAMRLEHPAPLLGAATSLVFLFVEDNPIWGGTLASTLAGEFSYTYGLGLAVLFLGVLYRAHESGRGPWIPGALLAVVAYAHGYAVLWAGLTASALLVSSPSPRRTLGWLLSVAAVAFGLAAPLLVPLLADWGWTTPYDDAWIDVSTTGLVPPLLWPLMAAAAVGIVEAVRRRRVDPRLLLLAFGTLAGAAWAAAGPALGVIDVRFVPFAQLSAALLGGAVLGLGLARLQRVDLAAVALVLLAVFHADVNSRVVRHWVDWNYSGLQAKELWPAWTRLNEHLKGGVGDPRVAVEYGTVHELAGSIRMYETLPFFSGRSTLEGVYNQASTMTHPVYYLASELYARSPNPFRSRTYSVFDPETALGRLPLFDVGQVVAVSPELTAFLESRDDVTLEAHVPPYTVFRLWDPGLVEPLSHAPVRAPLEGWRDASYRWMTRKPPNQALLVFADDGPFEVAQEDPFAAPPLVPLPGGVEVETEVLDEEIRIRTSRPGHPLLVKTSFHPRWRAEGAEGPFLASPGLMLVVPREKEVRLRYAPRGWPEGLGAALAMATVLLAVARRKRPAAPPPPAGEGLALARLLRWLPLVLVIALAAGRFRSPPSPPGDPEALSERASRAYADERWADAAEYARHAVALWPTDEPRRAELLWVRGASLLESGHPREALQAFEEVVEKEAASPHRPQALFSGARAREALGDAEGAEAWRRKLLEEYPDNPWTNRLEKESDEDAGDRS